MSEWVEKSLSSLCNFQKGKKVQTSDEPMDSFKAYLGAGAISGRSDGYASEQSAVLAEVTDLLMLWDGERSGYDKASLLLDGTVVHEHTFSSAGQFFEFQDTEVTEGAQIVEKLIWPAHAIHQFSFTAKPGANVFRLQIVKPVMLPLLRDLPG